MTALPNHNMGGHLFFFFSFILISWRLITLQYCSGFCHTLTWISHGFACVPHPNPPPASLHNSSLWVFPGHLFLLPVDWPVVANTHLFLFVSHGSISELTQNYCGSEGVQVIQWQQVQRQHNLYVFVIIFRLNVSLLVGNKSISSMHHVNEKCYLLNTCKIRKIMFC